MPADVSQILTPFGFTSLESEIYTFLLKEPPSTGYRVAQALGKAAANTYKAIESLQQKGALLVEDGSTKLWRAVPSDELLARLTRDFEWRRAEAELMLARLNSGAEDERTYVLRSSAQAIERARHMLGSAGSIALLACSARVAEQLNDALASCARRKRKVLVACPEPIGIKGIDAVVTNHDALDDLRLVIDGAEYLFALFANSREDILQAVWSQSPYLSVCAHRGMAAEFKALGLEPPTAASTPGYAKLL